MDDGRRLRPPAKASNIKEGVLNMSQKKGIVIICNLDTRGEDIIFVKHMIEERGHTAYFLDFSMEEPPPFPGDITCEQVAERGGMTIEAVRECYRSDRDRAMENQIRGAISIVADMMKEGKVQGVFGVGGGTSSLVGTSVMKSLPFGMPKLMASPMAAHPAYVGKYVGTHDITMHHTVLDVVKMNPLLKAQIINAVGAICGMVEVTQGTNITVRQAVRCHLLVRLRRDGGTGRALHAGGSRFHSHRLPCAGQG